MKLAFGRCLLVGSEVVKVGVSLGWAVVVMLVVVVGEVSRGLARFGHCMLAGRLGRRSRGEAWPKLPGPAARRIDYERIFVSRATGNLQARNSTTRDIASIFRRATVSFYPSRDKQIRPRKRQTATKQKWHRKIRAHSFAPLAKSVA